MAPLRILILSDGRPGHYHLSDGIAAAIARRRPVEIARAAVTRGRWPGAIAARLVNSGVATERMLKWLSGLDLAEVAAADVILSAGAETLPASVLLARARQVPNIFYGSLRSFRPDDFALVLTSYERNAGRPRHALALKPSAADPEAVRPGAPRTQAGPIATIGLLVGGASGTFRYDPDDWRALLALIDATHGRLGIRWLVSNSRRTDEAFSDALAERATDPSGPITRFVDVRRAGAGTLREIFAAADAIAVTDDSSSMISEAIWMRLPVVGLQPRSSSHPPDEQIYRDWLAGNGWCRSRALDGLTPEDLVQTLTALTPLEQNPLDSLADLLATRLPRLFTGPGPDAS